MLLCCACFMMMVMDCQLIIGDISKSLVLVMTDVKIKQRVLLATCRVEESVYLVHFPCTDITDMCRL